MLGLVSDDQKVSTLDLRVGVQEVEPSYCHCLVFLANIRCFTLAWLYSHPFQHWAERDCTSKLLGNDIIVGLTCAGLNNPSRESSNTPSHSMLQQLAMSCWAAPIPEALYCIVN